MTRHAARWREVLPIYDHFIDSVKIRDLLNKEKDPIIIHQQSKKNRKERRLESKETRQ